MRRRFRTPASVPSGVGSGPAAVTPSPSPVSAVSRAEEEAKAVIWQQPHYEEDEFTGPDLVLTPATDPTAAPMVKKRGRPKGSKNRARA